MGFEKAWLATSDIERHDLVSLEIGDWDWSGILWEDGTLDGGSAENDSHQIKRIAKSEEVMVIEIELDWEEHVYSGCPDMPTVEQRQTKAKVTVYEGGEDCFIDLTNVDIGPSAKGNDYY